MKISSWDWKRTAAPRIWGALPMFDTLTGVLIVLPPSETKAAGGTGPRLDLTRLVFPELTTIREALMGALEDLAANLPQARAALKVSAKKDADIAANAMIRSAGTMPAIDRYTGVLFDALDITSLTAAEHRRAASRIYIASALFGAIRASDNIPAYRLSAGSKLPGRKGLATLWRAQLTPLLTAMTEPIIDLRSGAYAAFAPLPNAITVQVVTQQPDGTRRVVSHFNKATKGLLARAIASNRKEAAGMTDIVRIATSAGLRVEQTDERALQVIT